MQRTNRLEEAPHNNPREHEAPSLEKNARGEGEDADWDVTSYTPGQARGIIIPAGLKRDGFDIHAARNSSKGQYDPSIDRHRSKEWRVAPASRLTHRDQGRLQSVDAPFGIAFNDITFMERPSIFSQKDKAFWAREAQDALRKAQGVKHDVVGRANANTAEQRIKDF